MLPVGIDRVKCDSPLLCQMDVVLRQNWRPGDASVENVGIEVRSVRPGYGAHVRIDADLREAGGVTQRLEDSLETEMGREIYHALNAVLESKVQAIIAEGFCANNVHQHVYSKGAIGLSCASLLARFQSSINSTRCIAAHSVTNPSARGERRPLNRASVSMAMRAFWPE